MLFSHFVILLIFLIILSWKYYYFHKEKYITILIFFLWTGIALIIKNFLEINISIWAWFWLFAILSMIKFREKTSKEDIIYIFLSIIFWILAWIWENIFIFFLASLSTLIILFLLEKYLPKKSLIEISLPFEDIDSINELVKSLKKNKNNLDKTRWKNMANITSVKNNKLNISIKI